MEVQTIINILISVVGAMVGWILKGLNDSIKELHATDKSITEKVAEMEVLVAGHYCKREDLKEMTNAIFTKLDRIEDKLDGKADKS